MVSIDLLKFELLGVLVNKMVLDILLFFVKLNFIKVVFMERFVLVLDGY